MKIYNEVRKLLVSPCKMKNGDFGEIQSGLEGSDVRKVVCRCKDMLIVIDGDDTDYWDIDHFSEENEPNFKVRILPKGTLLEV